VPSDTFDHRKGGGHMKLKLSVVISLVATVPICAEAQTSNNATVMHAQNALKITHRQAVSPNE
jgi:hypothetical protein